MEICKNCGHPVRETITPFAKNNHVNWLHYHKEYGAEYKCLICDCMNPEG